MQNEVSTDRNIEGGQNLTTEVESVLNDRLGRFSDRLTRIEVHLSDENSKEKSGSSDMRCLLEARLAGRQPIAVSDNGSTWSQALDAATKTLEKKLKRTLDRLDDPKGQTSFSGDQTS